MDIMQGGRVGQEKEPFKALLNLCLSNRVIAYDEHINQSERQQ